MELTGRVFDNIYCSSKKLNLEQVRKIVHGSGPLMREYPNHKFPGCHVPLVEAEADRHVKEYLSSPATEVSWIGLERIQALPLEDQPLSDALNDHVYLRVEYDHDDQGRDPASVFSASKKPKPKVSLQLSDLENLLNRELARTARDCLLFPCALNVDPGVVASSVD
ncbi:hypothetical protein QAD02_007058 [Eretmocerus hayati]|uniref:Uncharacterized protein n=1 Tax=Eretmocerus hayati TaxID=131215 RepID=A0ACC2N3V2_9HYME|nr:hypothetical protein QAD02_007058 [Eretmocerus hayati]